MCIRDRDYIVQELNTKHLFDFEYTPTEGDYLVLSVAYLQEELKRVPRPPINDYMAFIFTKGRWKTDIYDAFTNQVEEFKHGKICIDQTKEKK